MGVWKRVREGGLQEAVIFLCTRHDCMHNIGKIPSKLGVGQLQRCQTRTDRCPVKVGTRVLQLCGTVDSRVLRLRLWGHLVFPVPLHHV